MTGPLGVVVVDDSAVQRRFLRSAIEAASEFTVVGEARNGTEAVLVDDGPLEMFVGLVADLDKRLCAWER